MEESLIGKLPFYPEAGMEARVGTGVPVGRSLEAGVYSGVFFSNSNQTWNCKRYASKHMKKPGPPPSHRKALLTLPSEPRRLSSHELSHK
ncbi:hypothetical protein DY000_02031243 [Brassica cretica]|uniref:Uncharacterized protein n=1 Tax=Brassica cretica TaxID=69181 RepID=A0ABQ7DMS9_BRACR|nr:hypothetical protein DY000_02031243 [Brassica cretica]